ncbi:glutathione S-transferase [Altererythrobacter salegens]|uniref:Glutathione S-transferase n=1 Tax=Croceibacterium salegens TaxID=1737568 RepID=A0A6I4SZ55_9SPHN|nr:glutathione S-transferase [Croceibacterium salegens]MXO61334.1 glutathione S-transferase [Croceibacterium salegens]
MLTIHHLGLSQSDRIIWLCEEIGVPYRLDKHDRDPVTGGGPESYKALSVFGTAPVITDGNLVLGESAAIIEYVINTYGDGRLTVAPGSPDYASYLFWFHFANGSLMPAMMFDFGMHRAGLQESELAARLGQRTNRAFRLVEQRLGEATYFAGTEFTAADIMMLFPLTMMRKFTPRDISNCPNLQRYLANIVQRPAYRRTLEVGDPGLAPLIT